MALYRPKSVESTEATKSTARQTRAERSRPAPHGVTCMHASLHALHAGLGGMPPSPRRAALALIVEAPYPDTYRCPETVAST